MMCTAATRYEHMSLETLERLKRQPNIGAAALDRIDAAIAKKAVVVRSTPTWESELGLSEKEVQRRINQRLRKLGVGVYWMSQARKSGQTAGVPDLICFDPIRGLFFVEVKAEGGVQSEVQKIFQSRCRTAGVPYVLGGLTAIEKFLKGGSG